MGLGARVWTLLAVIAIAAILFGVSVVRRGFSAREEPWRWEAFVAQNLRKIAIPSDAKRMQNPHPPTSEKLQAAQQHWVEHCAMCHALDGSGDTLIGRNLYPKPPDMRTALTQDLRDGELYYIIYNGIRFTGMPAWSDADGSEEIWELVGFIRRLPYLTPAELRSLEELAGHVDGEDRESRMPAQGTESDAHQH